MLAARTVTLCGRSLPGAGHICAFFDSRNEEYEVLGPYYKEGIELDEEVITIVDTERQKDHCGQLEAQGIDVAGATTDGQLEVLTSDECALLRVYDVNEISGRMMMEVLQTHAYILYGGRVRENPYYVPPVDRLREVLLPDQPAIPDMPARMSRFGSTL